MKGRKKFIWLMSGAGILVAGFVLLLGLFGIVVLAGYFSASSSDEAAERIPRRRPVVFVTFEPTTPTSATETLSPTHSPEAASTDTDSTLNAVDVSEPAGSAQEPTVPVNTPTTAQMPTSSVEPTATPISDQATSVEQSSPSAPASSPTSAPQEQAPGNSPVASPTTTPTTPSTVAATPTPTFTPSPTNTPVPTNTPQPSPGSIAGKLVKDGSPANGGVVRLEDQGYNVIAETTVNGDGSFEFTDLPASEDGYNVLFSQDWNSDFQSDSIISWGWLGPIPVQDGDRINLPEFDISAAGFKQVAPNAAASFSAAQLNTNPVVFEWAGYPQANTYWVDLTQGDQQTVVWQSAPTGDTSITFNGTLSDGSGIQPGSYWWGVGARRNLDGYSLTVYGYLISIAIEP